MNENHVTQYLKGCSSVLDLCAGTGRWLKNWKGLKLAVELNPEYNKQLSNAGYNYIFNTDVTKYTFSKNDAVIWIEGIEHIEEEDAIKVLKEAEDTSNKVILVFTPNNFNSNEENENRLNEPLQIHKSCFPEEFWTNRGYEEVYRERVDSNTDNILYLKRFKNEER